jgi:2-polyprenyl-3-methyl-5-hydroxy-6-metoxy-1,4-benzoquinol methylase
MNSPLNQANTVSADGNNYRDRVKSKDAAAQYLKRKPKRERAERRMVEEALRMLPTGTSLIDVPCGNGRMTEAAAAYGCLTTGADMSEHVLANARSAFEEAGLKGSFEVEDIEHLSYEDRSFDVVLCFRYFHHLPTHEIRERVSNELVRVAKNYVFVSYMHPWSLTSLKRRLRHLVGGKKSKQHTTTRKELFGYFERQGFGFAMEVRQLRFFRSLHLACFVRKGLGEDGS